MFFSLRLIFDYMKYKIGIDIGGTFNDFVIFDQKKNIFKVLKTSTTPDNYWHGINLGIEEQKISLNKAEIIAHGTTIGLNTLLQRTGSKVGLITTEGFRDAYEIIIFCCSGFASFGKDEGKF